VLFSTAVAVAFSAVWIHKKVHVEYKVHQSGCVLVTGASTGIGRSAALALLEHGFTVHAGVRRLTDADKLRLAAGTSEKRLVPMLLDVTKEAEVDKAVEAVQGCNHFVALVNNAGVPVKKPLETVSMDKVHNAFDVNVFGVLRITQKLLPLLRKSQGRIINVGSVGGSISIPMVSVYSATKYALEAMSDGLRRELQPWGISVSMVNPGYITTDLRNKSAAQLITSSASEEELYGKTLRWMAEVQEPYIREVGSPCCASSDGAILHAATNAYPMTRYYPAIVWENMPANVFVPFVKLLSVHPYLDRIMDTWAR